MQARHSIVLAATLGFLSCSSQDYRPEEVEMLRNHAISYADDGEPREMSGQFHGWSPGSHLMTDMEYEAYIDNMIQEIRNSKLKHVMIFIHGGLNSPQHTEQRILKQTAEIKKAGIYPIYINWQSSGGRTYIRQLYGDLSPGESLAMSWKLGLDLITGLLYTPIYLVSDLGNLLLPGPTLDSSAEAISASNARGLEVGGGVESRLLEESGQDQDATGYSRISPGGGEPSFWSYRDGWGRAPTYLVRLLTKGTTNTVGTRAWVGMRQNSMNLFEVSSSYRTRFNRYAPTSRIDKLLEKLAGLDTDSGEGDLKIALVGHSMGTMAVNEILLRATGTGSTRGFGRVPVIDHIVYMGAACSVRDYERAVYRYLVEKPDTLHFHLTLHPKAELNEVVAADVLPRGSLLVWIDEFFEPTPNLKDRTVGRFTNLMPHVWDAGNDIRDRIYIRCFDLEGGDPDGDSSYVEVPQKHGDFTQARYWRGSFWLGDMDVPPGETFTWVR